ncbi:hypothetical protein VE03_05906 [Pseudogymnoascus sp. 23342-1-I1]|nr:hypothetical protein VE03_05906 [Pseudogymnoascus sp. 23342-1-I1]
MITEIATLELAAPADLSDPSSPTTSTIRTFLTAVLAADGAHAAYFGQSVEKPDIVIIFIDWDSTDAHHQFLASPASDDIASPLLAITNPAIPPQILHLPPIPHALLGEQPDINISEIIFFYFSTFLTPGDILSIMATMSKLRPALDISEARGVFEGWAEEGGVVYVDEKREERCKALVSVVGWESVEAHGRFVGTEEFRTNREVVMGMGMLRGVEMFNVMLVKV